MNAAPLPGTETARLELLSSYRVMDTPAEEAFDDLARLAAQVCEVPIGLVTLVDQHRQWFKARVGLDASEISRDVAFCAHTILGQDLLIVSDATQDPRFADNPQVTGPPHLRFYAGVPLRSPEGLAAGTLCVFDSVSRQLSTAQQGALIRLGRLAASQLELRRMTFELERLRIEAGTLAIELGPFDPRQETQEVLEVLRPKARARNLELVPDIAPDVPRRLLGDPRRIRQLLTALIGNAVQFTDHGHILVEIRRDGGTPDRPLIRFQVSDTGIGIAPSKLDGIFDRITPADAFPSRRFGGTGLGLALCRQLVLLMGGTIGATSAAGQGSTFWFCLPLAPVADAAPPPLLPGKSRVLVVDDNTVNQKVAARMLAKLGCTVEVAAHGREALEMVMKTPYTVIFMDCMMPEMDGYEATGAIRKLDGPTARTPIVAMTANAMQGDRERCLASGMDDYLSKPVQPELLRQALERWTALARPAEPAAPAPVDPKVLEAFRQLQDEGGPDVVLEFIDLFLADLPVRREAIIQSLSERDTERTRAAAHALKSSASYIGAQELARICRDLEAAARRGDTETSAHAGVALEQEADRVVRYLESARQGATS